MDVCTYPDFSASLPADNSGQKLIRMEQGGHRCWPVYGQHVVRQRDREESYASQLSKHETAAGQKTDSERERTCTKEEGGKKRFLKANAILILSQLQPNPLVCSTKNDLSGEIHSWAG